jgi:DNA-binding LytR/AlgR family response regulator
MSTSSSGIYILAVEDDPLYAEGLEYLLKELGYGHHSIVDNAIDALRLFRQQVPDLLLMDIGIAGPMNGIEFVETVSAIRKTPVIYVTAFSDNATFEMAKQTGPSAYLLKPYDARSLELAMELALFNQDKKKMDEEGLFKIDRPFNAFFVKYNNRLLKIPVTEILFIEVEDKYCYVHTTDRRYAVHIRMKDLLAELHPDFVQTHRSFAVRRDAIQEVLLDDQAVKVAGKDIPIGKTYREQLFAQLKMI